jgi:hypothetical protein
MSCQLLEVFKTGLALESHRFADKWEQSIHIAVTFLGGGGEFV